MVTTDERRELVTALLTVEKMVEELPDYFQRNELFRQLVVHTPWGDRLPKMTLGGLVERLRFLEQHLDALTPEERARVEAARRAYEDFVRSHRREVEERLRREFKSFLGSWKWYLDDLRENPGKIADYRAEAHNRRRLSLLIDEARRWGFDLGRENLRDLERLDAWFRTTWPDLASEESETT